jgi:protease-4
MHLSSRFSQPWYIDNSAIAPLMERLRLGSSVHVVQNQPQALTIGDFIHQRQPMMITQEGIAVIEVCGTLGRNLSNYEKICGDTDYNDIMSDVGEAVADDRVKGIMILNDSGGGSVVGAAECRQAIVTATLKKPVLTYTESCEGSACYMIGAGATKKIAAASSIVGSIGTILARLDISGYYEQLGVKFNVMPATQSDLKSTFWAQTPLTDAQRDNLQQWLDRLNVDFMSFVKLHRMDVEDDTMRGQCFDGLEAATRGLVDEVGNFDEAYEEIVALSQDYVGLDDLEDED